MKCLPVIVMVEAMIVVLMRLGRKTRTPPRRTRRYLIAVSS